MTSKSRPQRKRKQYEQFSPILPEEEKELKEALAVSLRKIPENGDVSENDCLQAKKKIWKKRKTKMKKKKKMIMIRAN